MNTSQNINIREKVNKFLQYDGMIKLIKKYLIVVISLWIINLVFLFLIPILIGSIDNIRYAYNSANTLINLIIYFICAIIIYGDMKKEGLISWWILILTLFNYIFGVVLFLIMMTHKEIESN
jgi:hypothetical protein